jgi:hypothetical protein
VPPAASVGARSAGALCWPGGRRGRGPCRPLAKLEAAKRAAAVQAQRDAEALAQAEAALAAEITAREAARDAGEQQWERAVSTQGVPLPRGAAPAPVEQAADVRRARQRVERARARLAQPDTARVPVADPTPTGSPSSHHGPTRPTPTRQSCSPRTDGCRATNAQFAVTADQIVLELQVSTNAADIVSFTPMVTAVTATAAALHAGDLLDTLLFDAGYCSEDTLTAEGPDRLIALGKTHSVRRAARDRPTTGDPPEGAGPREAMDHGCAPPKRLALHPPRRHRRTPHRQLQNCSTGSPPRPRRGHRGSPPHRYRVQPAQGPPIQTRRAPGGRRPPGSRHRQALPHSPAHTAPSTNRQQPASPQVDWPHACRSLGFPRGAVIAAEGEPVSYDDSAPAGSLCVPTRT